MFGKPHKKLTFFKIKFHMDTLNDFAFSELIAMRVECYDIADIRDSNKQFAGNDTDEYKAETKSYRDTGKVINDEIVRRLKCVLKKEA